jgi:hypothetical protein
MMGGGGWHEVSRPGTLSTTTCGKVVRPTFVGPLTAF